MRLPLLLLRAGLRMLRGAARRRRGEEEPSRARRSPASSGPAREGGGPRGRRGEGGAGEAPPAPPLPPHGGPRRAGLLPKRRGAPRRVGAGRELGLRARGELQLLPLTLLYAILRDRGSDEKNHAERAKQLQLPRRLCPFARAAPGPARRPRGEPGFPRSRSPARPLRGEPPATCAATPAIAVGARAPPAASAASPTAFPASPCKHRQGDSPRPAPRGLRCRRRGVGAPSGEAGSRPQQWAAPGCPWYERSPRQTTSSSASALLGATRMSWAGRLASPAANLHRTAFKMQKSVSGYPDEQLLLLP